MALLRECLYIVALAFFCLSDFILQPFVLKSYNREILLFLTLWVLVDKQQSAMRTVKHTYSLPVQKKPLILPEVSDIYYSSLLRRQSVWSHRFFLEFVYVPLRIGTFCKIKVTTTYISWPLTVYILEIVEPAKQDVTTSAPPSFAIFFWNAIVWRYSPRLRNISFLLSLWVCSFEVDACIFLPDA